MLNIVLVAINARFTHTNPALRSMKAYAEQCLQPQIRAGRLCFTPVELTINEPLTWLEQALLSAAGDVYLFSAYIWNIDTVRRLCETLKKSRPDLLIGIGGPEVSYTAEEELNRLPEADFILSGEGEFSLFRLSAALLERQPFSSVLADPTAEIPGFVSRFTAGPPAVNLNLDEIPYYWPVGLPGLRQRMIYYESSRGCPFSCTYCLSSLERGIRYRSLDLVLPELEQLIQDEAMLVKFVDRSFNADAARAIRIWEHLIALYQPGCRTTFHFEIEPALLDEASLAVLERAPEGFFQLEIGIQTTTPEVLAVIRRTGDFQTFSPAIARLRRRNNMHLHLDLIAGLPGETLADFARSFNEVFALRPHALQLGFLKVLKGTEMERTCRERGIRWRSFPPYEVVAGDALSEKDLSELKEIEVVLERYYNSGFFADEITELARIKGSAYHALKALAAYCKEKQMLFGRFAKDRYAAVLFAFIRTQDAFFAADPPAQQQLLQRFESNWRAKEQPGVLPWETFCRKYATAFS